MSEPTTLPFTTAVAEHLGRLGWAVLGTSPTRIEVAIPIEATGQQAAAKRGDHLSVWVGDGSFSWAIHPPKDTGLVINPAPLDVYTVHPVAVVASIDHLLMKGDA
jgi:hypothetical protein